MTDFASIAELLVQRSFAEAGAQIETYCATMRAACRQNPTGNAAAALAFLNLSRDAVLEARAKIASDLAHLKVERRYTATPVASNTLTVLG